MRLPRPTPAFVVACVALFLAAGGGAYAAVTATGSAVNIVDATTATQIAKVDKTGKVLVGDGSGNLSVDGVVSTRALPPASPWHATAQAIANGTLAFLGPTASQVDVTSLHLSAVPPVPAGTASLLRLVSWEMDSSRTDCNDNLTPRTNVWESYLYAVEPEVSSPLPTPLVLRASSGHKLCLGVTLNSGQPFDILVNVTGYLG